jgi:hypothetical protein
MGVVGGCIFKKGGMMFSTDPVGIWWHTVHCMHPDCWHKGVSGVCGALSSHQGQPKHCLLHLLPWAEQRAWYV